MAQCRRTLIRTECPESQHTLKQGVAVFPPWCPASFFGMGMNVDRVSVTRQSFSQLREQGTRAGNLPLVLKICLPTIIAFLAASKRPFSENTEDNRRPLVFKFRFWHAALAGAAG